MRARMAARHDRSRAQQTDGRQIGASGACHIRGAGADRRGRRRSIGMAAHHARRAALSNAVGLDRANTADVIARLAERRFIQRRGSRTDKRKKLAELTDVGRALLARLEVGVERAHERTLAALPPKDRKQFMTYLVRLVDTNNELSRTPIRRERTRA